jgi:hypothetical protein
MLFSLVSTGKPLYSGRVLLLPFMEQAALYDQFDLKEPWDSPKNLTVSQTMLSVFLDPAATTRAAGQTDYLFVTGKGTIFEGDTVTKIREITDGTSNTIFFTEKIAQCDNTGLGGGPYINNFWPDWGPIIGSPDCPGGFCPPTGPANVFQPQPVGAPAKPEPQPQARKKKTESPSAIVKLTSRNAHADGRVRHPPRRTSRRRSTNRRGSTGAGFSARSRIRRLRICCSRSACSV